jgi:hypothetical protein
MLFERIRVRCHNLWRIRAESVPKMWQIRQPVSLYPTVLKRSSLIQLAPYFTHEITKIAFIRKDTQNVPFALFSD